MFLRNKAGYEDTIPSNTKGKSPADWNQCLTKWEGEVEQFELAPKDDVIVTMSLIHENDNYHYLLSDENFPLLMDLFWSS